MWTYIWYELFFKGNMLCFSKKFQTLISSYSVEIEHHSTETEHFKLSDFLFHLKKYKI